MIDLSTWLTKQEAADRIGVSTKAIERFTRAGKLEQRFRPQAGSPHVAVYFPDDVAKLAQDRQPGPSPFVLPAVQAPANGNGHQGSATALTSPFTNYEEARRLFVAGLAQFAAALKGVSETSQTAATTVYLTIDEAAGLLNWTPRDLRRAIRRGEVPCRFTERRDWRTWRIRRKDLEAL